MNLHPLFSSTETHGTLQLARRSVLVCGLGLVCAMLFAAPALAGDGCASTSFFAQLRSSGTGGVALSSGGTVQGAGQFFEAPEALLITGFSFYAYTASGEEAEVTASIYLADMAGLPTGSALASTAVPVDHASGSLSNLQRQASFNASVLVDQDYVLVIENSSATEVQLIAGDPVAGDGQGEGLSSLLLGGAWQNGLAVTIGGAAFDADFLLQPDYVVVDFFLDVDSASPCLQAPGTLEFSVAASPVFTNRFYNADLENAFSWTFGDDSEGAGANVQHAYDGVGPWPVRATGRLDSGPGAGCQLSERGWFGSIPVLEEVAVSENFANFQVTFSPRALATEGWSWELGDGASSTAEAPRHTYPGLGFFTACVTTFNRCGEIPEFCIDVLSPFPDISLVIETETLVVDPGSPLTYTVEVWNYSGAASGPQSLTLQIPSALSDVTWSCQIDGTGVCGAAGTDSIIDTIQIDPQSTLTYTVSGTYTPKSLEPLFLFAEVTTPVGDETADNRDFVFVVAPGTLFVDGFETGDTGRWESTISEAGGS